MDGLQAAFAEYVQTFFLGYFGVDASSYDQEHLKLTKSGPDTGVLNFHPVALNSFHFLMSATIQMKWHDCINSILCFRWSSMVVPSVHRSCILPGRTFEEQHSLPWRRWEVSNTSKTVVLSQELHARNKLKAYASYDCGDLCCRYHLDLCANVFGNGTYPEVDITNLYYGGSGITGIAQNPPVENNIHSSQMFSRLHTSRVLFQDVMLTCSVWAAATNIFFTNGSQDPWRHASKQVSSRGGE